MPFHGIQGPRRAAALKVKPIPRRDRALVYNAFMAKVQVHAHDRLLFTLEVPPGGLRPRMKKIMDEVDRFSRLLDAQGRFAMESAPHGRGWRIDFSGGPDVLPESAAWAGWVGAAAMIGGGEVVFGGVTGLDGVSLPAEEIRASDFPRSIDAATLGVPHDGLRRGIRRLQAQGVPRPGEIVAGLTTGSAGTDETAIVSRFARRIFADPSAVSLERLPLETLAVRIGTRALPLSPFALPAYALAVRALLAVSLD
jgi:hypothetical protein